MPRPTSFLVGGDIAVSESPRVGRRFHMDVSEEALARIGGHALEVAVVRLGEAVAYRHQPEIERAVASYIHDRKWAEPIIREAIRNAVREVIRDMLTNTALGDMLSPDSESPA